MTPSGFHKPLVSYLREDSDCIWVVYEPLLYWSETVGQIEVPVGFETDFASVPRVPVAYQVWGDRAHRESVLHDYLNRTDAKPPLPCMEVNRIFLEAMKSRHVPRRIRWPMYLGVCLCNWMFYHRKKVMDKL
jgi:hypothetical protein